MDLYAPGESLAVATYPPAATSPYPTDPAGSTSRYRVVGGTSMSSPLVAGVVARAKARGLITDIYSARTRLNAKSELYPGGELVLNGVNTVH